MFVMLWKNYFFTLFQSNFFQSNTKVFSEQLLFLRRSFSEQSLFLSIYFSEQLLFQSETSTEQPHLENRKFFSAVTFRNSYLQKISPEELLSRSRLFCTTTTFSKSKILEKATFSEKQCSVLPTFSGELLSIAATFSEELLFYNI